MRPCATVLLILATGCSQILGLAAPHAAPADASTADATAPDAAGGSNFTLQVTTAAPRVPQGGFDYLAVAVTRTDFTDAIVVDVPSPPPGVMVTSATVDGSATTATLTLTGSADLVVGSDVELTLVGSGGGISHELDVTAAVTFKPGIPDPGFGSGSGILEPSFGAAGSGGTEFSDVSLGSDDSITAVGFAKAGSANADALIVRFTAAGAVDASFANGPTIVPSQKSTFAEFFAITRQSDGSVVAGGIAGDPADPVASQTDAWLAAYDINGEPVLAFGGSSDDSDFLDEQHGFTFSDGSVSAVIALPDDELMVNVGILGEFDDLAAQNSAGTSLDTQSFDGGSAVKLDFFPIVTPQGMTLDPSGATTYVIGFTLNTGGQLVHILANGTLDPAFGDGGTVVLGNTGPEAVAVQANGDILLGASQVTTGQSQDAAVVERLLPDSSLDATFGSAGVVNVSGPFAGVTSEVVIALAVQGDGKIVVIGATTSGEPSQLVAIRLLADGSLDPTYGDAGAVAIPAISFLGNLRLAPSGDAVLCGQTAADQAVLVRVTD